MTPGNHSSKQCNALTTQGLSKKGGNKQIVVKDPIFCSFVKSERQSVVVFIEGEKVEAVTKYISLTTQGSSATGQQAGRQGWRQKSKNPTFV